MAIPAEGEREESERCPICGGRGWIIPDVPPDHLDFGKAIPCQCTLEEFKSRRLDKLEQCSNLGPLTRFTFDNLEPLGLDSDPEKQRQFSRCWEEAKNFAAEPKGWLVLTGPSGCGKTHMAAAIANQCIKQRIPAFFVVIPDFLDHLRATFSPSSDVAYDEFFEHVRNSHLLILDDLGTHSSTPWAEEKLFQILNHRFNVQLPTVITALSIEDLEERLRTRLKTPGLTHQLELGKGKPLLFRQLGGLNLESLAIMNFENFDIQGMNADREQRESLKVALEAARGFAESPENWLVLVGPPGSGKTHLVAAIANQQLKSGCPVFFTDVSDLLDYLRPTFEPDSKRDYTKTLDDIKLCPLLILDDLGMETATAWTREKLYQILNYRYNARSPTVITITHPSLEGLDARLRSRLMDPRISNVIPIGAPDYRGQVKPAPRYRRSR